MVKIGSASGGREVRRSRIESKVDRLDQMSPSRKPGRRPAMGGTGICGGMRSREMRNGSEEGYAASDVGESKDRMRSTKDIDSCLSAWTTE